MGRVNSAGDLNKASAEYAHMMWPIPSVSKSVPSSPHAGSFWENREDRFHCGIDIPAEPGADVIAIESGKVVRTGVFTSPEKVPYWNVTRYIVIENDGGNYSVYAELQDTLPAEGAEVAQGQLIGHVGQPLNPELIDRHSPEYIRKEKEKGALSMLHFELLSQLPDERDIPLGNWFEKERPDYLLDPTRYLQGTR